MAAVKELIRCEENGCLSFGDYTLDAKTKKDGFEFQGDLYKVKTFKEITKLERNGMFVYESVPGTAVYNFESTADATVFTVFGLGSAMITVGVDADSEYTLWVNDSNIGELKTGISAKLNISAELSEEATAIKIIKK